MKQIIALLLCILLTLGSLPVQVFAEESAAEETTATESTVETTAATEPEKTVSETTAEQTEPEESVAETTAPTEAPPAPTEAEPEPPEESTISAESATAPMAETVAPIEETLESQVSEKAMNADTAASGTCGENLTWTLDSEGVLTISGTGSMASYGDKGYGQPWDYMDVSAMEPLI